MRKINLLILTTVLGNIVYASPNPHFCGFTSRWPDSLVRGGQENRVSFVTIPNSQPIHYSINFFIDMSVDATIIRMPREYINNNPSFMGYLNENNLLVDLTFSEPAPITGVGGNTLYRLRKNAREEIVNNNSPISARRLRDSIVEILLLRNREITDTDMIIMEMLADCLDKHGGQKLVTALRSGGFLSNKKSSSGETTETSMKNNVSNNTDQETNDETGKKEFIRTLISVSREENITQQDLLEKLESQGLLDKSMITAVEEIFNEEINKETENNDENGSSNKIPTTTAGGGTNVPSLNEPMIVTMKKDEEKTGENDVVVNNNQEVNSITRAVNDNNEDEEIENNDENDSSNKIPTTIPIIASVEDSTNEPMIVTMKKDEEETGENDDDSPVVLVENDTNNYNRTSFFGNIFSGIYSMFQGILGYFWNRYEENPETNTEENIDEIPVRRVEVMAENVAIDNDNHETSFLGNILSGISNIFYRITGWWNRSEEENSDIVKEINTKEKKD